MVKLNSTTAILSDLDGVILNIDYDIKFWESWLPEYIANQSSLTEEEAKAEILSKIDLQRGTLNFYDLNYWDDLLDLDCMEIIKEKEEKCSYLEGSYEALQRLSTLENPKYILTNGDPRIQEYKAESNDFLKFFDSIFYSMLVGYPKESREFWALASLIPALTAAVTTLKSSSINIASSKSRFKLCLAKAQNSLDSFG